MDNLRLKERLNTKVQTMKEGIINMNNTAVSIANNYVALTDNALEIIRGNLKKQPLSTQMFDVVKSPSGGSTVFPSREYRARKPQRN